MAIAAQTKRVLSGAKTAGKEQLGGGLDVHGLPVYGSRRMKSLEPPDSHHLQAAQGWIGLGNYLEAKEELERIDHRLHLHPDVLEVRWQIYAHAKEWAECVDVAEASIKLAPERFDGWIHRSFALHEMECTQQALGELLPAADKFPKIWTIPYNLACYCAQLGLLAESNDWLQKAMAIDAPAVRQAGIHDPDLKPLWDSMKGTI